MNYLITVNFSCDKTNSTIPNLQGIDRRKMTTKTDLIHTWAFLKRAHTQTTHKRSS